jgi:hypothetical protein
MHHFLGTFQILATYSRIMIRDWEKKKWGVGVMRDTKFLVGDKNCTILKVPR